MANKIFSIYKSGKELGTKNTDRITLEICNRHVACMVVGGNTNHIEEFELFETDNVGFKNFEESFAYVVIASRLLGKHYIDKKVFINSDQSVIIPKHLYSAEKSSDYLDVIFGDNNKEEIFNDSLNNQSSLVNAYRISPQVKEVIERNLSSITIEHTYTNIINDVLDEILHLPPDLIKVQFYKSHFIAAKILCD